MGFLIAGGYIFWGIVALISLLIFCTVEYENSREESKGAIGWPFTFLLLFCSYLVWKNGWYVSMHHLQANLGSILMFVGVFWLLGIAWSFFKWYKVNIKAKVRYDEAKLAAETRNKETEEFNKTAASYNTRPKSSTPSLKDYLPNPNSWKASITSWICFWPFSILRYIFGTMISDALTAMFNALKDSYKRMTYRIFKISAEDLK